MSTYNKRLKRINSSKRNLPPKPGKSINDLLSTKEKICEIYNDEFEDFFPNILLMSKEDFFTEITYRIEIIISEIFSKEEIEEKNIKELLKESNSIINEKYENNYNILSKAYYNYISKPTNYSYLKNYFTKHCINTEDYAYHNCEYQNSKLIEIPDEKNKNEILYLMCSNCKKCYFPNQFLLTCNYCKVDYYSCLISKNENPNFLPATWEKYHCQNLKNESMKCIKCKNILYLNIRDNKLYCLNKKCNFTSKPQSILWNCTVCKKEFRSDAQVYNPLEIKNMKKAVKLALIFKKNISPFDIPCCKANPKELIFFHKSDCKGELFEGNFKGKEIIVCSKCHAINFFDKFIWICPLCHKRFRNNKSSSWEKFIKKEENNNNILFNSMRKTEQISCNYNNILNNQILRSSSGGNRILTSFHSNNLINIRNTNGFNDNNHIANLITEIYPNNTAVKKNPESNVHHKHIKSNKKQYKTLIEILAERNKKELNKNHLIFNHKKNNSLYKLEDNEENKDKKVNNIIIINEKNDNGINVPNISDLRKIASNSTNEHSFSNKSYGNNSNPPTNKIKRINVNKNENNIEEDDSFLNINKNERKRGKIKNENDENENNISQNINNNNNNNNISIRKQLEKAIFKNEERVKIEKMNKKEKSEEINKKIKKDFENESSSNNSILTIKPRKKNENYISKKESTLREKSPNKENNKEEDYMTHPELLKEIIESSKIPIFNIENFVFKDPIGEGSYGKIYLIQKEKTHERYALKKIICHELNEIKQFKREFELIYSKSHSNIMKIYNIEYKCLDSTTYSIYVLMELALSDWTCEIKRRQKKREYYKESEIIQILNQILDALIYLEENGIAHRDIKPQNILIYPNNIYKVADFGEARNLSYSIQECTLRGSELYMSPVLYHCLKNKERDVIHNAYKSDVFSLGLCLLYSMALTIQVLNDIREINNMNFINQIIKKALRRNYSINMQNLIQGMLQLDEKLRFSFQEIKNFLKKNF